MAYTKKHIGKRYKKHGRRVFKRHHTTGPTSLSVPRARQLQQPIPDRLFTWLTITNSGYFSAGSTAFTYNFGLNSPVYPFDVAGGGATLDNPVVSISTYNPVGMNNLLYNSTTGSGLYKYYRVWTVKASVCWLTQALADNGMAVLAAQVGDNTYGNSAAGVMQASEYPNSVTKMVQAGQPVTQSTLRKTFSIPTIMGISKKEYAVGAAPQYTGYSGTAPSLTMYGFTGMRTLDQANTSQPVGTECRLQYHIEFFQRVDSPLLLS